jgi:hypothetical protein
MEKGDIELLELLSMLGGLPMPEVEKLEIDEAGAGALARKTSFSSEVPISADA